MYLGARVDIDVGMCEEGIDKVKTTVLKNEHQLSHAFVLMKRGPVLSWSTPARTYLCLIHVNVGVTDQTASDRYAEHDGPDECRVAGYILQPRKKMGACRSTPPTVYFS